MSQNIEFAMNQLREAMIDDEMYAYSWHCHIAMMCYDAIIASKTFREDGLQYEDPHKISNDAATRFMKLCFDVETKYLDGSESEKI